ncbi:MAG: methylglyoxal synthase [Prevotellaceae bacterium]|jgi:methylglyoxal synthase|nr:methylglyoxal synthase [Prevotellaceae bacterium]
MKEKKTIALVAHDNRKRDIIEWVEFNHKTLIKHNLVCTGTTGRLIEECLQKCLPNDEFGNMRMMKLKSGPLGGDQQLGSLIVEGKIDVLIFLWDPMQPQPHDVDVKALLRISSLYNIPTACNRSTADFIISSPIMGRSYKPMIRDYSEYIERKI